MGLPFGSQLCYDLPVWRRFQLTIGFALGFLLLLSGTGANAESQQTAPAETGRQPMPDAAKIRILIYDSLIALNQANLTGNYTVLRDLGAASFRVNNTAAHLSELFAELRLRKIDLAPIVVFEPKLLQAATVNENGLLRLLGLFETEPEQVLFDLVFAPEQGDWRIVGIAVQLRGAPPKAASSAGKKPKATSEER